MKSSFKAGDIFELNLQPGFAYLRFAYFMPQFGEILGVIHFSDEKCSELAELDSIAERWFFLADLPTLVKNRDLVKVGSGPPPATPPPGVRVPVVDGWNLVDVGSVDNIYERPFEKTLSLENLRRPIDEGVAIQNIREMIRGGYDATKDSRDLIRRIKNARLPLSGRLPQD